MLCKYVCMVYVSVYVVCMVCVSICGVCVSVYGVGVFNRVPVRSFSPPTELASPMQLLFWACRKLASRHGAQLSPEGGVEGQS